MRDGHARRALHFALALLLFPGLAWSLGASAASGTGSPTPPSLIAYRGVGMWVDIFEDGVWANPEAAVQVMKSHGVRTIYVESSNYSHGRAVVYPQATGRMIEAAHAAGMRVVAWYLPSFRHLSRDYRRSMGAIHFHSIHGQSFDSFALDIEAETVRGPAERTRRLLALSRRIREAVGPSYPLGAITPNPVRVETDWSFWPSFPYRQLTYYYDVFVPMDYFGSVAHGEQEAHDYTAEGIRLIREGADDPTVPIHVIGGLAEWLDGPEVLGFVKAVRENGAIGASLYNYSTMGPSDWARLAAVPVNPRQRVALPAPIREPQPLGFLPPGADRTHPKEVFYRARRQRGARDLTFQIFDAQPGELRVLVNWVPVAAVAPTASGRWGATQTVTVPGSTLRPRGRNLIAFTSAHDYPNWDTWGVRDVALSPAA